MTLARSVAVALTFVGSQAAPPDGATFGRAPLAKGARVVASSSNQQNMKSTVKGGGVEQAIDGTTSVEFGWTVAVTEVDAKGAKAAAIDVTRARIHIVSPLGEQDDESKVVGPTWQATRASDGWSFAAKEGAPPDEEALATLRSIATRTLDPSPLAKALDGKRLAVGETVKLAADDARRMLATLAEAWTVTAFELKLASVTKGDGKSTEVSSRIETARFEAKVSLAASGAAVAGADATMELTGELIVATSNSLVLRASLSGPVKLDGKLGAGDAAVTITGSGDAKWTYSAELKE